jgi:hypothetical protein
MDVKMDDFVMKFVTRYKICDKYMDFATFFNRFKSCYPQDFKQAVYLVKRTGSLEKSRDFVFFYCKIIQHACQRLKEVS